MLANGSCSPPEPIFGLAFMGPLIWWMNAVSNGAYVALVLAETAFFAVIMLALRAACRLRLWPLWGAAVWVLGETARGSLPFSGFPWGRLAHTAIDTPFAPYARLLGMPGTTAVLFVVAAMVVVLATAKTWRARVLAVSVVAALTLLGCCCPPVSPGPPGHVRWHWCRATFPACSSRGSAARSSICT